MHHGVNILKTFIDIYFFRNISKSSIHYDAHHFNIKFQPHILPETTIADASLIKMIQRYEDNI